MATVIVMGAGVVGVTSAWYLQQQGFEVTVIERQSQAGMETSFANGGQISVSHAQPWASPSTPKQLIKWLAQSNTPLQLRPSLDRHQWLWSLAFLRECTSARHQDNIRQIVNLGLYSRLALQQLRHTIDLDYHQVCQGILHFYTNQAEFVAAQHPTQLMQSFGLERQIIDAARAIEIEPALVSIASELVGATYTSDDESGNAHEFTQGLAQHCANQGVTFLYDTSVCRLHDHQGQIRSIEVVTQSNGSAIKQHLSADHYVVCLGSYSPLLLRPLGVRLQIYPAKGYSATYTIRQPDKVATVSLTDDEYKLVMSRYGNRFRVAGMAELSYSLRLDPQRYRLIDQRVQTVFGSALDYDSADYWTGLRPMTPSNVPYIGRSSYNNLWLNTGHGTLGWTHACGSGKALSLLMTGQQPKLDFQFCQG